MTAIACYFQRENDVLYSWAVADSRVSQAVGDGTYKVYHDHAVKIFSIPFTVTQRVEGVVKPKYRGSFGFCYSGSSLTGLNAHAAFSHLLKELVTVDGRLPRLSEIAEFVASVLRQYIHARGSIDAACECAVLGRCPFDGKQYIFRLQPTTQTADGLLGFNIDVLPAAPLGAVALLGDEKQSVQALIDEARARATTESINWFRAPWHGINEAIASGKFPTIGGQIQLGVGLGSEFVILARQEVHVGDQLQEVPEFLGLTLSDDSTVGPCKIGIPRMGGLKRFPLEQFP